MKNTFLFLVLLSLGSNIMAQEEQHNKAISFGYFSNYLIQPGVQINSRFDIKTWQQKVNSRKGDLIKSKSLFIRPQLAYFTNPEIHQSILLKTDFGYRRVKPTSGKFIAWSLGLGYLAQSQVIAQRINLGDGSKEKIRERWDYIVPTINYEFGKAINKKVSWYSKYSLGYKIGLNQASSTVLYIELGLSYHL